MRNALLTLITGASLLVAGCNTTPTYTTYPVPLVQGDPRPGTSQQIVINNTGAFLDVLVDGVTVAKRISTGQTVPIPERMFYGKTVVIILAYDDDGRYIGTDHWIFNTGTAEVWQVNNVWLPSRSWRAD